MLLLHPRKFNMSRAVKTQYQVSKDQYQHRHTDEANSYVIITTKVYLHHRACIVRGDISNGPKLVSCTSIWILKGLMLVAFSNFRRWLQEWALERRPSWACMWNGIVGCTGTPVLNPNQFQLSRTSSVTLPPTRFISQKLRWVPIHPTTLQISHSSLKVRMRSSSVVSWLTNEVCLRSNLTGSEAHCVCCSGASLLPSIFWWSMICVY